MKILHIMPFIPLPEGPAGAYRIYHLLRTMSTGHDITVLAFGFPNEHDSLKRHFNGALHGVHIVPYRWVERYPRLSQIYSLMAGWSYGKRMQRTLDILLFENDYDLIQAEFSLMGLFQYDSEAVKILDFNMLTDRDTSRTLQQLAGPIRRMAGQSNSQFTGFHEEAAICSRFDAVFVTRDREKYTLDRKLQGIRSFVIPNGIDLASYRGRRKAEYPFSIYLANFWGRPVGASMVRFLDQVLPLVAHAVPQAKLYIPAEGLSRKLRRHTSLPVVPVAKAEARQVLERASIVIGPLQERRIDSTAVLEAMALRKPVVATRAAYDGIDAVHGESILRENTPEQFAAAMIELLGNASLRRRIGDEGYDLVRSSYDWKVIGGRIDTAFRELLEKKWGRRTISNIAVAR